MVVGEWEGEPHRSYNLEDRSLFPLLDPRIRKSQTPQSTSSTTVSGESKKSCSTPATRTSKEGRRDANRDLVRASPIPSTYPCSSSEFNSTLWGDRIRRKWLFRRSPAVLDTQLLQVRERENHRCQRRKRTVWRKKVKSSNPLSERTM